MAQQSNLEKHVQTGIQIILTGAVGWMAMTTQETSVQVAKMSVQIESLEEALKGLREEGKDAYTLTAADRDHQAIQRQIDDLSKRLDRVEGR